LAAAGIFDACAQGDNLFLAGSNSSGADGGEPNQPGWEDCWMIKLDGHRAKLWDRGDKTTNCAEYFHSTKAIIF